MAERARFTDPRSAIARFRPLGPNSPAQESPFAGLLTSESLLRLALSFVLALALWLYVTGKQDPDIALDLQQPLPIQVAELDSGLVMTNELPSAHIRYRTASPQTQVSSANFRTFIDLLNVKPGTHRNVRVVCEADPGISCASVTPNAVTVVIDVREQAHVPVIAHLSGQPAQGYYAQTPQFYPSTVTVDGARTTVSQITGASVSLNLSGLTSSLDDTFRPTLIGTQGTQISAGTRLIVDPVQVTVHVGIKSLSSFKPLPVVISSFRGQPKSGYGVTGVTISPPEVTVQGSPSKLRTLSSVSTGVVNIRGRKASFSKRVPLILPRGVSSSTRAVTVTAQIQPLDASTSLEIEPSIDGAATGLSARAVPSRVVVSVVGPASATRQISAHLRAVVNVSGFGAGTYQLSPAITVPPGFHVTSVYPGRVTVVLAVPQFGQ